MKNENDQYWMQIAFEEANKALQQDEVPIGAIIVKAGKILSRAYNKKEQNRIVTHHAEILALEQACKKLKTWRLSECTLYSTLEPCLMCAGAIYQARISRVVFAALDPKSGALGSLYDLSKDKRLNHYFTCEHGILATESTELLKNFFKHKRNSNN